MGITLILVMGMLAFIINVGLFVKAKINLQNAVDAAAFSGAATQARQLTNIANLNWEMRNTFKEWMFKYYILGHMAFNKGNNNLSTNVLNSKQIIDFYLQRPAVAGTADTIGFDKYNVPSICVHNNSTTDICPIYALPGIPRFPAVGVAGISEIHEAFVNKLVQEKGENCSARTKINFLASLAWAYSSGIKEIPGAPLIATNRVGAWPQALELAMRIRNLEMIVNRPPVADLNASNLSQYYSVGQDIGLNERPMKAFMSAFRNLGGGKYKDAIENGSGGDSAKDELAASFTMTEIAPQPFPADEKSVSGFLIPSKFNYQGETGVSALNKHYLDLQAMPVNYTTLFTTFVTSQNKLDDSEETNVDAGCKVSKSAMPVPGYILGFVKNPEVLTYYAVKGEAEFTGLFFPRSDSASPGSFKLTAYAAAKPFGGRIGPRLFSFSEGNRAVVTRDDDNSRTSAYVSGIDITVGAACPGQVGPAVEFCPGMPIPSSPDFWARSTVSSLGGVPGSGTPIAYGIPNMIYDFDTDTELAAQNASGRMPIQVIRPRAFEAEVPRQDRGLYQSFQIKKLKEALGGDFTGRNMTQAEVLKALIVSRRVTKYDAVNYLIPDFTRPPTGGDPTNAAPTLKISEIPTGVGLGYNYSLFAPLVGENLLYETNAEVGTIVLSYMASNEAAIKSYLKALLNVANAIYKLPPASPGSTTNLNAEAAKSIHANAGTDNETPPDLASPDPLSEIGCNYKDMASKFHHFFTKTNPACGIIPLEAMMIEYIDKKNQNGGNLYYTSTYYNPLPTDAIMTAYYPGPRHGTNNDATNSTQNPIGAVGTAEYSSHRNFYSTKFIPLQKVTSASSDYKSWVLRESDTKVPDDLSSLNIQNLIPADGTTGLNNPFYRDF